MKKQIEKSIILPLKTEFETIVRLVSQKEQRKNRRLRKQIMRIHKAIEYLLSAAKKPFVAPVGAV